MAKKFMSAGEQAAALERTAMRAEGLRLAARETARKSLLDQLEYERVQVMATADLTWDQRVQYSIAVSLKLIGERLDK